MAGKIRKKLKSKVKGALQRAGIHSKKHKAARKSMGVPLPEGRLSKAKKSLAKKAGAAKTKIQRVTSAGRAKKIGAAKGTVVSKGAKGVEKTKGGDFVKYKKDSKAAGGFRKKFKSACAGGAKSFSWQGRSYSCAKKAAPKPGDKKFVGPVQKKKTKPAGNPTSKYA
jgi:hypothetical protein